MSHHCPVCKRVLTSKCLDKEHVVYCSEHSRLNERGRTCPACTAKDKREDKKRHDEREAGRTDPKKPQKNNSTRGEYSNSKTHGGHDRKSGKPKHGSTQAFHAESSSDWPEPATHSDDENSGRAGQSANNQQQDTDAHYQASYSQRYEQGSTESRDMTATETTDYAYNPSHDQSYFTSTYHSTYGEAEEQPHPRTMSFGTQVRSDIASMADASAYAENEADEDLAGEIYDYDAGAPAEQPQDNQVFDCEYDSTRQETDGYAYGHRHR